VAAAATSASIRRIVKERRRRRRRNTTGLDHLCCVWCVEVEGSVVSVGV
jgi:hypothetical protein